MLTPGYSILWYIFDMGARCCAFELAIKFWSKNDHRAGCVPAKLRRAHLNQPHLINLYGSGSNVAAREAGAITQKVAAFSIDLKTGEVLPTLPVFAPDDRDSWPAVHPAATFIDTPGTCEGGGEGLE